MVLPDIPFYHGTFGSSVRHSIMFPKSASMKEILATRPSHYRSTFDRLQMRVPNDCKVDFASTEPIEVEKVGVEMAYKFICNQVIPHAKENTKAWAKDWLNTFAFQKGVYKVKECTKSTLVFNAHVAHGLIAREV
jgi:nickel-dependent lactate racemase